MPKEELKDKLLSEILQGLKQMCNHCSDNDCDNCWSNEICNKIIMLLEEV